MKACRKVHLCIMPKFHVGEPAPAGYLAWHEWARVQHRAGLRQLRCARCGLWRFPREIGECCKDVKRERKTDD